MNKKTTNEPPSEEFKNFQEGVKRFVSVSKVEIEKREAEWREMQARKPQRAKSNRKGHQP